MCSLRNTSRVGTRFHTLYVGLESCTPDTYHPLIAGKG